MQKMVNIKIKIYLKSNIMVWNTDFYYSKNHYLSYNIFAKILIQDLTIQKSKFEEFISKKLKLVNKKPALFCTNEPKKTFYQNKKKNILKKSEIRKTLLWPQKIILLRVKVSKNKINKVIKSTIIIKNRAILLATTLNL